MKYPIFSAKVISCIAMLFFTFAHAEPEVTSALTTHLYKRTELSRILYDPSTFTLSFRADDEDFSIQLPEKSNTSETWHLLSRKDDVMRKISEALSIKVFSSIDKATQKRTATIGVVVELPR